MWGPFKKKEPKPKTTWDRIVEFKNSIVVFSTIVTTALFFYSFIAIDLSVFKDTAKFNVVESQGLMYIRWDLKDLPKTPGDLVIYIDGKQFETETYPLGLLQDKGVNGRWTTSYILPLDILSNPGKHSVKAIWVFKGWATLGLPVTAEFSTNDFIINDYTNSLEDNTNEKDFNINNYLPNGHWV